MLKTNSVSWSLGIALIVTSCHKSSNKYNLGYDHKDRELIVTLKENGGGKAPALDLRGINAEAEALNDHSYLIRFKDEVDLGRMADKLAAADQIKTVEANVYYRLLEKDTNDPDFAKLYALKSPVQLNGTTSVDIRASAAWDIVTGSKDVLVAITDTGVDYSHPDLIDNIWTNPGETGLDANGNDKRTNGIDDDGNGFVDDWHGWDFANDDNDPMDDNGHGTHVAGTIGATGNNGIGVTGVNWSVSMVPIKVFTSSGSSTVDSLVKGVEYASKLGVFVSNNSWGSGPYSDALFTAIKTASDKSIIFVASAGNEGESNEFGDHYPANYDLPNVISVAASGRKDQIYGLSNYGATSVDLAAPGEGIYSTLPNGRYGLKSGTSMAAPHVTGALALLRARFPDAKPFDIKEKLLSSAEMSNALMGKVAFGRINIAAAMEDDGIAPSPVVDLNASDASYNSISLKWSLSGDDGDVGIASRYDVRLSATPVTTEDEWANAQKVTLSDAKVVDSSFTATINNLEYNRSGFLSIRAIDNAANISELSPSVAFSVRPSSVYWLEGNDVASNWESFGGPWTTFKIADASVVSDGPEKYANNLNASLVSKELKLSSNDLNLEVRMKYDFEKDYDFGLIEVSTDAATWVEVGRVTGASDWTTVTYNLQQTLGAANSFRVRLRLKTDSSGVADGWDVDSLKLLGPALAP